MLITQMQYFAEQDRVQFTVSEDVDVQKVVERDADGNITKLEKTKGRTFTVSAKDVRRQLYGQSAVIAMIRSMREATFEYRHLVMFLLGSDVDIVATLHKEGELIGDFEVNHDFFTYDVRILSYSEQAAQMLEEAKKKLFSADSLFD